MPNPKHPVTCSDCYFRCAQLCALPGEEPCPTFRLAVKDAPQRPRQAQLVAPPGRELAGVR